VFNIATGIFLILEFYFRCQ